MHDRLNTPVRVGCPESAVYGSGDHFEKTWNLLRGRKRLGYKSLPDSVQIAPDLAIPSANLAAGPLIVRRAGSASGKHVFDTLSAVSLVRHQEIRQFRVELLAVRTAQTTQEKDDSPAGSSVHFTRFPIVGGKVSSANRTAQRLRPRNNKNSFSRFLVKLDTITTLQYKKASGCPAGNRTTTPGAFAFLLECH